MGKLIAKTLAVVAVVALVLLMCWAKLELASEQRFAEAYGAAIRYQEARDYPASEKSARVALTHRPRSRAAHRILATSLLYMGRTDEARRILRECSQMPTWGDGIPPDSKWRWLMFLGK